MELVFRIIDQAGHRHELRRLGGPRLTIGRAYDNDLVLTDPTVSPCHAVIEETADGRVVLRDLDSLNGVFLGGRRRQRLAGETELVSGGVYQMGKSRVMVFSTDHPVPDTVRIGGTDNAIELLDNPLLLAGAVLLAAFIYGAEQWLNMFSGFEWRAVANVLLVVLGSSLAVAIFWAVVGQRWPKLTVRWVWLWRKTKSIISSRVSRRWGAVAASSCLARRTGTAWPSWDRARSSTRRPTCTTGSCRSCSARAKAGISIKRPWPL